MTQDPIVSHGRGGAGNIGGDSTKYTDGEIVRTGPAESSGAAVSTGRGGAANIAAATGAKAGEPQTTEQVPEAALRLSKEGQDHHVGRGGQGNIARGDGAVGGASEKPGPKQAIKNLLGKESAPKST